MARLCILIAEALEHAHRNGIIHRDLKPSNVMIDEADQPHLLDFGRYILQFKAATGFTVVLEYARLSTMEENKTKIEAAGLECERLKNFSVNFDQADLFMDMRSPECIAQFDLDDWI